MTTFLMLLAMTALVAALVAALGRNHHRNGCPRVAGFTGRIGELPAEGAAAREPLKHSRTAWQPSPAPRDDDDAPLFGDARSAW